MQTSRAHWSRILLCLCWLALPSAARADWQGFLRLDGIAGEAADTNHLGWLPVQNVEVANINSNRTQQIPLCFQRTLDTSSPLLMLDSAKGTAINSGTLDLTGTNFLQMEFFRLNLTNVVITSVTHNGDAGVDSRPQEQLCLYSQILSWNYAQFSPRSGLPTGYQSSSVNLATLVGAVSTNLPVFMSTGVRKTAGVELDWTATAGRSYRIYAVPDLTQPFLPLVQMTASSSGPTNYTVTPAGSAMFFVVEQIPAGL